MPARTSKRWTADEARQLNEANPKWWPRYEVVDGELLVSPAPRVSHQIVVGRLVQLLRNYLEGRRIGEALPGPGDIELEVDSTLSPDAFVVPYADGRFPAKWNLVSSLLLVAEVLSPSTARYDRVTKRDYFMRNGVPVYWIVDIDGGVVERWLHGQDRPDVVSGQLTWHPNGATEPLVIDVQQLLRLPDVDE